MLLAYRRHIVIGLQLVMAACGAVGLLLYLIALRPSHLSINAGTLLRYRVSCEINAGHESLGGDFTKTEQNDFAADMWLLALPEQYAVINPDRNQRSNITLADYSPLGRLQRRDSRNHLREDGVSLYYFDLNLMPLPPGGDQHWDVEVFWNALPVGQRAIRCRVQRLTNGMNPRFRLRPLAPIQWVSQQPQPAFAQVRDLTVDYVYDSSLGGIKEGIISFSLLRETHGDSFSRHDFRLTVQGAVIPPAVDPPLLSQFAHQAVWAQTAADFDQSDIAQQHRQQLKQLPVTHPIIDALRAELLRPNQNTSTAQRWFLRVAAVPTARLQQAEALANDLTSQGFPAFVRKKGDHAYVAVGPYGHQNSQAETALRAHPQVRDPFWEQR